MRRLPVFTLLLLACSSPDEDAPQPTTTGCPADHVPSDSGCVPVQHEGACEAGSMPVFGSADCVPVGWSDCPDGFEADPSGWGCRAVAPEGACPAGSMPKIGSTECQPVGWTDCPVGFEPDPSGWGCRDVVVTVACTGATRAALGSAACVAIGDCSAPFPPASATLFVDDDYTAAQLDATHFATIGDALAVALDGDVIAVESGAYVGAIFLDQSVAVVGRCAAEVTLDGGAALLPGVHATGPIVAAVSGFTLLSHVPGVQAKSGASLAVSEIVVEGARDLGVFGQHDGTLLVVEGSAVRGTQSVPSDYGFGVNVESGATVEVRDTDVAQNALAGVFVLGAGSTAKLVGSVVRDTLPDAGGGFGHGVHTQGGLIVVERSSIANNRSLGGYASGTGSRIELTETILRDTQPGPFGQFGHALQADGKASLSVVRSALVGNRFISVFLFDEETKADFADAVVRDTAAGPSDSGGRAISLQDGADATLARTALIDNREYGLVVGGPGTTAELVDSLIAGTRRLGGGEYGWGINCADGGHVVLQGSALDDNEEYGMAVAKGATGSVEASIVRGTGRSQFVQHDDDHWKVQGIGVQESGQLSISRSLLADNVQIGLYVWDAVPVPVPSHVDADALVVRGTLPAEDAASGDGNGAGVVVGLGASATITSSALVENGTVGLLVTEPGASATATNLVVRATRPNNQGIFGRAIAVQTGALLTLDASALIDDAEIALFLAEPVTAATVTNTLIADTRPAPPDGSGRGIGVQHGATLSFTRSTVLGSREVGVHAIGQGALVIFGDAIIGETSPRDLDGAFGNGIVVQEAARLELRRARVFGSAAVGVAFSASHGLIEASLFDHNVVALHVQDGSTIVGAPTGEATSVYVSGDTRFVDNQTRLGTGVLPLPAPGGSVAE